MKYKMYKTVYVYTTNIKKTVGRYKIGKADRKANSAEEAAMIRNKKNNLLGIISLFDIILSVFKERGIY